MSSAPNPQRTKRRGPPRPTTARTQHAGLVISLLFHAALLAGTWLTWRHMVDLPPESHAVPVELVVAQQTNVRAEAPPQPPEKIEVPKDMVAQPALPEFSAAEPAPEPPVPQFKVVEPKTVTDQPDQPKTKKQILQDADAVLNKILAQPKVPKNAKAGPRIIQGVGAQNMATADLADALKSQIYQCWSPPVGAPNAADLVVDFDVALNPDGSPARAVSDALSSSNPYTRAAAEAARRAIAQCSPYKLPADRYNQWREINPLRFDPRQMMNQ